VDRTNIFYHFLSEAFYISSRTGSVRSKVGVISIAAAKNIAAGRFVSNLRS
jgi:hypothetical protein